MGLEMPNFHLGSVQTTENERQKVHRAKVGEMRKVRRCRENGSVNAQTGGMRLSWQCCLRTQDRGVT